ncbi:LPS export ABC transporter periplasmic protein LptC [Flavobacterium sp. ANB]|uniref:LPS export ABC transporter periplasmic protein LptC n=1 Tax=unclassified Flavobacterium TaxID=196869 RepID=UPI0012B84EB9|nr:MULTISPECIES: LPS export ABC transporter periplasmic protein LptC [unclassified Flavobacterium]MBF4514936.1 LPS export ABC transporter periplasmic protein LptC [Flavobacterium sp. ANB]MTD68262.1 LPS export ABC transporter periplasmic protein LptC [Flavobacterium sp. LC2016-13]
MNLPKRYIINVVTVLAVTLFFGCESNFKEVQKINFSEFVPGSDADTVDIKYTDSGRITGVLKSRKMLDFSNLDFPFTEFPKGIDVTLYDKKQKRTFITSNYAVSYKQTGIIDLQGKVKITSETGQMLETEQLYFDQKNEWFYTERKFKLTDAKGVSYGQGIDFSKDFKVINSQRITGELEAEE